MENAVFQFRDFKIFKSSIEVKSVENLAEISIGFKPGGHLDFTNGKFTLNLGVTISDKSESLKVDIESKGYFEFENISKDDLTPFLYTNAPAILFPYLRAYISTLTSLSGLKPIILPTLNLSHLRSQLEENIIE